MEELLNVTTLKGGEEMQEPKFEQLMIMLRRLQQDKQFKQEKNLNHSSTISVQVNMKSPDKRAIEAEIKEIQSVSESVGEELTTLQSEAYQLEGMLKEKEELCRKLQFQCAESEQDSARQLNQNKKCKDLLEQYRCEIQEFKLKHRKQRMKFENQLLQLIEQHRNLHSVFTPERLPDEIENAQNTKSHLLSAEQLKLAQLHCLSEELQDIRKQKQLGIVGTEPQDA